LRLLDHDRRRAVLSLAGPASHDRHSGMRARLARRPQVRNCAPGMTTDVVACVVGQITTRAQKPVKPMRQK
jgi:hypothetical protein